METLHSWFGLFGWVGFLGVFFGFLVLGVFFAFGPLLGQILKHTHSKVNSECSRHWICKEIEMQATIPLAAYFGKNMRWLGRGARIWLQGGTTWPKFYYLLLRWRNPCTMRVGDVKQPLQSSSSQFAFCCCQACLWTPLFPEL